MKVSEQTADNPKPIARTDEDARGTRVWMKAKARMRLKRISARELRTMFESARSSSASRDDAPPFFERRIDGFSSSGGKSVVLRVKMDIRNLLGAYRLKGSEADVQGNGLDLDASSANGIKNLRGKVKARSGSRCTARLVRKDSLVAVAIFFPIVTVNVRRQRHVTDLVENSLKILHRIKPQGALAELSGANDFGLEERFRLIGRSEVKVLSGLYLAAGADERRPLVLAELLGQQDLDTARGIRRTRLCMNTPSPSSVQASRNDTAVVENEKIAGLKKMGKIAEEVVPVFAGRPIENEHAAGTSNWRRRLGDELFRQVEMKVGYSHCLILVCKA
jgi:hypothetical protein